MPIKKDKLSLEQKNELEHLRHFIVRQGLNQQMIGSDWRRVIDAVSEIPDYTPLYRLRLVKDPEDPALNDWLGPLPKGLPLYNFIEWLELNVKPNKQTDFGTQIKKALEKAKINYLETNTGIRIFGYKRTKK